MTIMWIRNKVLIVAALLLFYASLSTQVAPGDQDQGCLDLNVDLQDERTDPTVKMLMDSRDYMQLLDVNGAVWDQMDFDDNNPTDTFDPTYFQHDAGGICRWTVISCGFREGFQDNWLFTQYINKTVPPNTNYDVTVNLKMLYTLSNCRERHNCNPVLEVYMFNTNGPQSRDDYTNRTNYRRIARKRGAAATTQQLTITETIPPSDAGFYIAVRDHRSCIKVSQLKVFRHQCKRDQRGLVVFPETAAPVDAPQHVTAICVDNAHSVTDLSVQCLSAGVWSGSAVCVCNAGYERKTNSDGEYYCRPCRDGYYRSDSDPQTMCKRCPDNTVMDVVAAPMCQCLTGYFRNTEGLEEECPAGQIKENATHGCSKPPSMPLGLNTTHVTATTISIQWSHPRFLGGRSDHYYIVEYSDPDPDNVGEVFVMRCTEGCLNDTQCTITGLQPATKYIVHVTAHNGVSDQDKGGALARQKKITAITENAPPSVPLNILPFCEVIVWEEPTSPNGNIIGYDVVFWFRNGSNVTIEVLGYNTVYVLDIPLPNEEIEIKIRAVNDAGPGPYSEPDQLVCGVDVIVGDPLPGCPVCPSPSPVPEVESVCPSLTVPTTTVSVRDIRTETVTTTATINATVTEIVPVPTTVTVSTILAITVPRTITSTTTVSATVTETVPVPTTVVAPVPTTVAVTIPTTVTATATINATVTETVAVPTTVPTIVPTTVAVTVPTTVVVPTTFTTTTTINATVTETVLVPTTVATTVPTTVATTIPTTVAVTVPTTVVVPTTLTTTATVNVTVPVPTTVVTTTTATTTSTIVLSPSLCTTSSTSSPTATLTSSRVIPTPSVSTPVTSTPPLPCPTSIPAGVKIPDPRVFFFTSQPKPRPGNVANVKLLSCGVLVWDHPVNRDCSNDHMTYKVRIYNGTTFTSTDPAHKKLLWVDTTWVKLTEGCMPCARPLHITIKARKDDGVHSTDWSEPITMTEYDVVDCPW